MLSDYVYISPEILQTATLAVPHIFTLAVIQKFIQFEIAEFLWGNTIVNLVLMCNLREVDKKSGGKFSHTIVSQNPGPLILGPGKVLSYLERKP